MKRNSIIDKIITPVNTKYGAPMGRANVGSRPTDPKVKIYDCAVPMGNGGYDKGGAYWGIGEQLRVFYTKDLSYIEFYRLRPVRVIFDGSLYDIYLLNPTENDGDGYITGMLDSYECAQLYCRKYGYVIREVEGLELDGLE